MKRWISCALVGVSAVFFGGCAMVRPPAQGGSVFGGLYTDISAPHWVLASNAASTKTGSASCSSILGIVATGDASVQAAASSAGITKIHHVDYNAKSILFFWAKYTVTVYGE